MVLLHCFSNFIQSTHKPFFFILHLQLIDPKNSYKLHIRATESELTSNCCSLLASPSLCTAPCCFASALHLLRLQNMSAPSLSLVRHPLGRPGRTIIQRAQNSKTTFSSGLVFCILVVD